MIFGAIYFEYEYKVTFKHVTFYVATLLLTFCLSLSPQVVSVKSKFKTKTQTDSRR